MKLVPTAFSATTAPHATVVPEAAPRPSVTSEDAANVNLDGPVTSARSARPAITGRRIFKAANVRAIDS